MKRNETTQMSRILSVYHRLLNREEVSFPEFTLSFGVSQCTTLWDIRLLDEAGVLEIGTGPRDTGTLPAGGTKTRQKYLEKLRR